MPIALTREEKWDYVLERERKEPPDKRTVFELGALTPKEEAAIQDGTIGLEVGGGEMSGSFRTGSAILAVLKLGLRGWRNFHDGDGNDVVFPVKRNEKVAGRYVVDVNGLWVLSGDDRKELAEAITEQNKVTPEELEGLS